MINHILKIIKNIRPVAYGYKLVCCYDDKYSKPVAIYRGENAIYKFMDKNARRSNILPGNKKKAF